MPRVLLGCALLLGLVGGGCGGGDDTGGDCDLPIGQWSAASSGGLCQVNFFTDPEYAVYCGGETGSWDCACGPIADDPEEFISEDFCDLEGEARACEAIARCGFPL